MAQVVFLRGVNVGGHRTFRPAALAAQLARLGVVNVGAAGTFIVRERITQARLRQEFASRLPFETEIMICESREIAGLRNRDPFADHPDRPDVVRFMSVLARLPRSAPRLPLGLPSEGEWVLKVLGRDRRLVVGVYRRRMDAIRHLGTLDRIFGVPLTTRNWNTITAVVRALERLEDCERSTDAPTTAAGRSAAAPGPVRARRDPAPRR
jgi:uncharacterized protein (DUF1697 family)